MKKLLMLFVLLYTPLLLASIQLIKKENNDSNTTLLVIGGIHGNEPGGYFAPAILAMHYTITSKNLWIVPNLNEDSIIANKRGIHGDMNRKFATIKKNDKDKATVDAIKKIILEKKVSLVLNLHDGHGFYRKKDQNSIFNPNAWGQTCVIDQCYLNKNKPFGNLNDIACTVKNNINKQLLQKHHTFNVKNTETKFKDEQMRLSLTYFAITHNKPAFAIETSKSLSSLSQKVFYQLLAIEEYMKIVGIGFHRDFNLNLKSIAKLIKDYGTLEINHNILLHLSDIKKSLSYIPIKSRSNTFSFSHLLGVVKKNKQGAYEVYIGNKKITTLHPQYFKMSQNCPQTYKIEADGKLISLKKASSFSVNDDFKIIKNKNYRVNVIGYYAKNRKDESNITISKKDLGTRYAIDKANTNYRIEFYKNNGFCSMITVKFK
ncbi:putative periplasmic protein [hydrothermal vent metagenome]|uniref:Putative periplasmic protein n=1 Tax=hydrothermal vent metagenome TaxID=652676 RepID=A0A1W1BX55_9ZZZZ